MSGGITKKSKSGTKRKRMGAQRYQKQISTPSPNTIVRFATARHTRYLATTTRVVTTTVSRPPLAHHVRAISRLLPPSSRYKSVACAYNNLTIFASCAAAPSPLRSTTFPSLSIMNLHAKFQRTSAVSPDCSFKNFHTGDALGPFVFTLPIIVPRNPNFSSTNF